MREMRERILTEGWRKAEGGLTFSTKQVELAGLLDRKLEGFFSIESAAGERTEGYVSSSDSRMQCLTPFFEGSAEQIEYRFDTGGMQEGETRSGRFFIVSNCGEYELAWTVSVGEREGEGSLGRIANLFHFANLARTSWQEAVRFFYTEDMRCLCHKQGEEVFTLYRGYGANAGNEENVERFLVAVNKKQPIAFEPVRRQITAEDVRGHVSEEIQILKTGWGPVHLSVKAKGDFLSVEKSWIGEDDFLGNLCRIPVFLEEGRMHAGRNFGEVSFCGLYTSFTVEITAVRRGPGIREKDAKERALREADVRLVRLYEQLRTRQMEVGEWQEKARECVEEIARLTPQSPVSRLFSAQLLLTQDRAEEAGWILNHIQLNPKQEEPAVFCYYLYLTTLYNREESYGQKVRQKVEELFGQNPGEWRIGWLLLFLKPELGRSPLKKWEFLERRFSEGCTSPLLYLEAVQLLNSRPVLLGKLGGIEKRVLLYGARKGILGRELAGQAAVLASREKYYDPVLFRILKLSWERRPDVEVLQAICTLLIKGGKTGAAWYPWYLRGVKKELRIARLYEHYLMSVDLEHTEKIPRQALLYFAYQSNLDFEHAAWLYANVERHRDEDTQLYLTYRPQIDRFVEDQLSRGRISRDLAFLYRRILVPKKLSKEALRQLAGLLCSVEVTDPQRTKGRIAVVHARLKGEKVYAAQDGKACVDFYSRMDLAFWEDESGGRRLLNGTASMKPLFADPGEEFEKTVCELAGETSELALAVTDPSDPQVRPENEQASLTVAAEPFLEEGFGRKLRIALLRYFDGQDRPAQLEGLLGQLRPEEIDPADRLEVVRCLTLQGMYEKAYEWQKPLDPDRQDPRVLLRLCSRLLEQGLHREEPEMTRLCYAAVVHRKYDAGVLQQLTERYEGSVREMEALKTAAEGFGIDTYPLCERIMEQLLYTGQDVTERMDLLRQYVAEGGRTGLEGAFLHRCAYSGVMENQPIHRYMIHDMLRMEKNGESLTDLCRIAVLQYYAKNRDAMDRAVEEAVKRMGSRLLERGIQLPVLREFARLIPGAEFLLDKTFVVYCGTPEEKVCLYWRPLSQKGGTEYRSARMPHLYEGIHAMSFVLFPGESLQYFIAREEEPKKRLGSGVLKATEADPANGGRYGMLYAACAGQLAGGWQGIELLNRYLYMDFCADRLFSPLKEKDD